MNDLQSESFTRRLVADEDWLSLERTGSLHADLVTFYRLSAGLQKAAAWRDGNILWALFLDLAQADVKGGFHNGVGPILLRIS